MGEDHQQTACIACGNRDAEPMRLPSGHDGHRCRHCGLIWTGPGRTSRDAYESAYDASHDGFKWKSQLELHRRAKSGKDTPLPWFQRGFLREARPEGDRRILDVGCGTGRFLLACSRSGWRVAGLDISSRAVELARELVPDGEFHCGELDGAPWPAGAFEAVTSWEVIEHVCDPSAMVVQVRNLLAPGGTLTVSTPDWGSWAIRRHKAPNYWPPYHLWFFGGRSLRALFERAGLEVTALARNRFAWSETGWPRRKRWLTLPWLLWRGIARGEGGGRLVVTGRKPAP